MNLYTDWNGYAGDIVCRQLGYSSGVLQFDADFGWSTPFVLTYLRCTISDTNLVGCKHAGMDQPRECLPSGAKPAAVVCRGTPGPIPTPPTPAGKHLD